MACQNVRMHTWNHRLEQRPFLARIERGFIALSIIMRTVTAHPTRSEHLSEDRILITVTVIISRIQSLLKLGYCKSIVRV